MTHLEPPSDSLVGAPPGPRSAATVVLLRDGARGVEVLMLRRHAAVEFAGDAWVFPGGRVEDDDRCLAPARWRGIDPDGLESRFGAPADLVLGFHVAAVRETFEEAGLLLGAGQAGAGVRAGLRGARAALARDGAGGAFHDWLEAEGLVLDLGALTYLSRWVTPPVYDKRFDAAFFVARPPAGQIAGHDRTETTDGRWLPPAEALAEHEAGAFAMMYPTRRTLHWLDAFGSAAAAIEHARSQPEVTPVLPRAERDRDGRVRVLEPERPREPGTSR